MSATVIGLIGHENEGSDTVSFDIENGSNDYNIGDYVWISPNGKLMDIDPTVMSDEDWDEIKEMFNRSSWLTLKGMFRQMGYGNCFPS